MFPLTCDGTLLSHRTPEIFLQLVHPHCVLLFIYVLISPSLRGVLPRHLNSETCGSWADCILTLLNGVPFRHMYSVFDFDTFIPLSSMASLHCSSSNSSTSFSLAHSTTSSANIICQGASFMMYFANQYFLLSFGGIHVCLQVIVVPCFCDSYVPFCFLLCCFICSIVLFTIILVNGYLGQFLCLDAFLNILVPPPGIISLLYIPRCFP